MQKIFLRILAVLSGASLLGFLLSRLKIWEIEAVKKQPEPFIVDREDTGQQEKKQAAAGKTLDLNRIGKAGREEQDDLKRIKGIGPAIEEKLNGFGIFTYAQIARLSKEDEDALTDMMAYFPGRIERDAWVAQAKALQQQKETTSK